MKQGALVIAVAALACACGGVENAEDAATPDGAGADGAGPDGAGPDGGGPDAGPPDGAVNPAACNATTQDCVEPTAPKCTWIMGPAAVETECEPLTGMHVEGDTCMRVAMGPTGLGHDDCDVGLFCASFGRPAGMFTCRRFCDTDAQCTSTGEKCYSADGPGGALEGFCAPACILFSAGSCATGLSCS